VVNSVTGAKFSFLLRCEESKPTPFFLECKIAESFDQLSVAAQANRVGGVARGARAEYLQS
jgi:hypothetical protein